MRSVVFFSCAEEAKFQNGCLAVIVISKAEGQRHAASLSTQDLSGRSLSGAFSSGVPPANPAPGPARSSSAPVSAASFGPSLVRPASAASSASAPVAVPNPSSPVSSSTTSSTLAPEHEFSVLESIMGAEGAGLLASLGSSRHGVRAGPGSGAFSTSESSAPDPASGETSTPGLDALFRLLDRMNEQDMIQDDEEDGDDRPTATASTTSVTFTPSELDSIARLESMGFPRETCVAVFLQSDRSEPHAANLLIDLS